MSRTPKQSLHPQLVLIYNIFSFSFLASFSTLIARACFTLVISTLGSMLPRVVQHAASVWGGLPLQCTPLPATKQRCFLYARGGVDGSNKGFFFLVILVECNWLYHLLQVAPASRVKLARGRLAPFLPNRVHRAACPAPPPPLRAALPSRISFVNVISPRPPSFLPSSTPSTLPTPFHPPHHPPRH